jgi:hypothetical protein
MLFSELILTRDQRAALGCVALEAASAEEFVERALWHVLKLPPAAGVILTRRRPASQNISWLRDLLELGFPQHSDNVQILSKALSDAMDSRNTLIHGVLIAGREINSDGTEPAHEIPRSAMPELLIQNRTRPTHEIPVANAMDVARALSGARRELHAFLINRGVMPRPDVQP